MEFACLLCIRWVFIPTHLPFSDMRRLLLYVAFVRVLHDWITFWILTVYCCWFVNIAFHFYYYFFFGRFWMKMHVSFFWIESMIIFFRIKSKKTFHVHWLDFETHRFSKSNPQIAASMETKERNTHKHHSPPLPFTLIIFRNLNGNSMVMR